MEVHFGSVVDLEELSGELEKIVAKRLDPIKTLSPLYFLIVSYVR